MGMNKKIVAVALVVVSAGALYVAQRTTRADQAQARMTDESARRGASEGGEAWSRMGGPLSRSSVRADPRPVKYIERTPDSIDEKALLWMAEKAEFFESRPRHDASAEAAWKARLHEQKLLRFDLNGDGELDEFESEIMRRPQFERSVAGQKTLDRFDVNRDMRIDATEQRELEAHYRSLVQEKLDKVLPEYDANRDGRLNQEERAVYQQDVISQMATGRHEVDETSHRMDWLTSRLDMDGDERATASDTSLFLNHLARGSVIADLDRDGLAGSGDFETFRAWWFELEELLGKAP